MLLWPQLPLVESSAARPPVWIACGLLLTAALTARRAAGRLPRESYARLDVSPIRSWSVVWRDFRNWYGTVWAVRVMERINASAAMYDWPVGLDWDGFVWRDWRADQDGSAAAPIAAQQQTAIEQFLRNLLRRFVSSEWIEARLNEGYISPSPGAAGGPACNPDSQN
jgi:hypothetical protein